MIDPRSLSPHYLTSLLPEASSSFSSELCLRWTDGASGVHTIVLLCCLTSSCSRKCKFREWLSLLCFFSQISSFSASLCGAAQAFQPCLTAHGSPKLDLCLLIPPGMSEFLPNLTHPHDLAQQIFSSECFLHPQKAPLIFISYTSNTEKVEVVCLAKNIAQWPGRSCVSA